MIAGAAAAVALFMFIAIIIIAILVFEVWMFVDAIRNPRLKDTEKVLWCIGMLIFHPVVAIVYYFVARSTLNKSAS